MPAQNIVISHADTGLVTAQVTRAERISPSFVRLTLGGPELQRWRHLGFDQWFRLAIPAAGDATRFDRLSKRFDMRGYLRYATLPKATRPAIRSYTVRDFRADPGELDIDFLVHGDPADAGSGSPTESGLSAGIAGPWAASLPVGAHVALIDQGCGYRPGDGPSPHVVLAGDESALPAIAGILRDLPRAATGTAFIEVPDAADQQAVHAPRGVSVRWMTRGPGKRPGAAVLAELRDLPDWGPSGTEFSAFIAGEQQLASGGRRHLVTDRGVPKEQVAFCGYWRLGAAGR